MNLLTLLKIIAMKYQIKNIIQDSIIDNFEDENRDFCEICVKECSSDGIKTICKTTKEEVRHGKVQLKNYVFFLCCDNKIAKTTKLFREKIEMIKHSIPNLYEIYANIKDKTKSDEQQKFTKIVHNIKTINAQNIQELNSLIPQQKLTENIHDIRNYIENEIKRDIQKAALVFLRILKSNNDIKTEFSTHEKIILENNAIITKSKHDIRKVILNVYHSFALDFSNKNIKFIIFEETIKINFEYDTIRLALYHLFINTSKYIKPNSFLEVKKEIMEQVILIKLEMISFHMEKNELEDIFKDNYSGKKVKENLKGSGFGMGIIKKALELNGASIEVIAGEKIEKFNKGEYSKNQFIIMFQK